MKSIHVNLAAAYLERLDVELRRVPEPTASAIRDEIAGTLGDTPPEAMRQRIAELGDPIHIASEAVAGLRIEAPSQDPSRQTYVIVTAIVVALGGLLLPVLGWLVGLFLLWRSPTWTLLEKLVATIAPGVATCTLALMWLFIAPETDGPNIGSAHFDTDYDLYLLALVLWAAVNVGIGVWLVVAGRNRRR